MTPGVAPCGNRRSKASTGVSLPDTGGAGEGCLVMPSRKTHCSYSCSGSGEVAAATGACTGVRVADVDIGDDESW